MVLGAPRDRQAASFVALRNRYSPLSRIEMASRSKVVK